MYIDKIFPFLRNSDLIRCIEETVSLEDIYIPIKWKEDESAKVGTVSDNRTLKAYRVMPCDIIVLNEDDSVSKKVKMGLYGDTLKLVVFEVDYMSVVDRISVDTVDNVLSATMMVNDAYEKEEIVSDTLINYASNGIKVDKGLLEGIEVEIKEAGNLRDWIDNFQSEPVQESEDFFNRLMNRKDKGESVSGRVVGTGKDAVYNWLDSYFALPENVDMKNGGREVVPLLIGPTAVFKSATVKELCKKYNFRLVDFRVSFTSRLDYSGLFQIGDIGDEKFSYSCPMEEIVTCSDGFREYCRKAYDKVSEILTRGYLENNKASDGVTTDSNQTPITDEQREKLTSLLGQYKEYMKTPVLFFDEITRCFSGDTKVRLLDGRILTMREIHEEYGTDKPFWVYSCDADGNVRFAKAYSQGITRKNAKVIKVTLDNGAEVICTPDHRWMLRDGSYEQAQHFETGRSLMGTYFGVKYNTDTKFSSSYETFINPADGVEYYTHREVVRQTDTTGNYGTVGSDGWYYQAHHKDFDSRNNTPDNLEVLDRVEHFGKHTKGPGNVCYRLADNEEYKEMQRSCFAKAREHCPDFMDRQKRALEIVRSKPEYRKKRSELTKGIFDDEHRANQRDNCLAEWENGAFDKIDRTASNKKMYMKKTLIFIKVLTDAGYSITENNYDNFVDRFTGNHGVYYNVLRKKALEADGYTVDEVIANALDYGWESEYMHHMEDIEKRASRVIFDSNIQRLMDNPIDEQLKDYSDVNFKNAHVQKTLEYLNSLGDISIEEYDKVYLTRDKKKWQNVLKSARIREKFGSFDRAKEISRIYNHKVVKIEFLDETEDVYDITVPEYHNFLIDLGDDSGVFVHNCSDAGVEGVLVQLLNQKKFNNLTLNGCKFVAATNLNLSNDNKHVLYKSQLDDLYDVKQDIDVAYSNRFMPLQVNPEDVQDRWFEWAESTKTRNGEDVSSIHTMILNYLKSSRGKNRVYNDEPVMNAIDAGLSENEIRSQTFPNYRTWDMLSDYLYNIDDDYKLRLKEDSNAVREYRDTIIKGLISDWAAEDFIAYLNENGYRPHEDVPDDVGDFLESTLSAGVPALLIGPSSLGKTSRVNAYRKKVEQKTGLKPVLINVNLASKDTTDLMGYPVKQSLVNYVCGNDLDSLGLGSVSKDLQSIVEGVHAEAEYGMTDYLTRRAPDLDIKEKFQKALNEGREVILFFDECNRVQDKTVMSAMFECFTGENTVKLLDGRILTMDELYAEAENGNTDLWTYSVTEDGEIVPAHISCVIKKNPTKKIVEIEMEDGSIVRCTEDHKFMLKDGSYVMAKDLDDTMEIMEVESRDSTRSDMKRVDGYEVVSTNANPTENFTHRIVAESCNDWFSGCGRVIHHKDFNKKNNNPENLDCSMTYIEHIRYHGRHLEDVKIVSDFEERRLKGLREYYNDNERVERANIKRRETCTKDKEKWEERNKRMSETRRKKCRESGEYRKSVASALIRYNEKVKSGEIVRDYSYLKGKRPLKGEELERFRERAKKMSDKYWSTEESHIKQSERMKLLNQREDFREINRNKTVNMNKDPKMKLNQQIGKIRKVVKEAVKMGNFSKESYELARLNKYRYGVPTYGKAEEILRKAGISFDLILQEVL